MKIGDNVQLKPNVFRISVPEDREDHPTAKIIDLLSDIKGGVKLDRDLNGMRYWNEKDLEVI